MVIRVPRTSTPQEPVRQQQPSAIAPVQAISNPAAAAVKPAQQLAGLAADIYQQARDREIETRVSELDIQRRQADAAVVDGYKQALGKDAVDQRGDVVAAILQNSKSVRAGIKDREVAAIWKRQDAALTFAATSELDNHYRQQNLRWQADTQEARADLLVNDLGRVALGEGYDPATGRLSDEAGRTRSAYLDAIGELGSVLGWSKEQVENTRRKADTQALGQVADTLVRQDRFGEAMRVLDRHGDQIDTGTRERLAQQAREGAQRQTAEQRTQLRAEKAQAFTLQVADLAAAEGGTIAEQRAFALATAEWTLRGKKLTAEEYDAAVTRIERHYKQRDETDSAQDRQVQIDAERFLNDNPLATLQDNPQLFEAAKQRGLLKGLLEFERSGRYSTDPEVFARARALPDADLQRIPPDRLWSTLRGHLSNQDLDEIMARQARAIGSPSKEQLHIISMADRLEKTARELHLLPDNPLAKPTPEQQKRFDSWRQQLNTDLEVWQTDHGKKATPEDVQKRLDLQVTDTVEVVSRGFLWDSIERVPLASLPDRQRASVMVGSERIALTRIPEREFAMIGERLSKRGVDPTAQNIAEVWSERGRPGDLVPAEQTGVATAAAAGDEGDWVSAEEASKLLGFDLSGYRTAGERLTEDKPSLLQIQQRFGSSNLRVDVSNRRPEVQAVRRSAIEQYQQRRGGR